jgi:hypothetical protein
MRSQVFGFLVALYLLFSPAALAHDVTVSTPTTFAALDGSSSDHDGTVNGVFTVNDGNLVVNAAVNCNDDATESACSMAFNVTGDMTVNGGGALYAENRSGSGTGGAITLTVGGDLSLAGGAVVSSASKSSSGSTGGAITATVAGSITLASGSTIDSGSANGAGGAIAMAAGGQVSADGNVLSGPSRTILSTRLYGGPVLDGGSSNSVGGAITIASSTFAGPAVAVGSNANIVSQGSDNGAGPVTLEGCGVEVRGLVAALARKSGAAKVHIRSGQGVLVDGRDLGASGTRMGRVRADAPTGTALGKGIDVFATEDIAVLGPAGSLYVLTSLPGLHDSKSYGGLIRVTSLTGGVTASGNAVDDGHSAAGDTGGTVEISAQEDVVLDTAVIRAHGDFSTSNNNRGGGVIRVRSYSGDVIWTNGLGEVRPVGSTSNLALADQGSIVLTACGTIDTTGSTFPVMGTATGVFPETHTGSCSPAGPSLPAGVLPLITCNTPPVADDASASTNEDTSVTITLSGSDADGDPLTFSIVSGPSNGSLGAIVPTGPTTATVTYSPNLNYNGGDSFVYQVNDGNGGTDNATVTITIAAVNDPPSFLAGPTVSSLEDGGSQSYPNWATAISAGPADESGQTVTFSVSNDNPALFSSQPAVAPNGTLTWTPAPNAYGSATISVVAQDNGGTANGGNDTSAPQTSTISITPVNDEPSFTPGGNVSVNEDSGAYAAPWASAISAGPGEGSQTVSFTASAAVPQLFAVQPAVSPTGVLTFTPAADASGTTIVTVTLSDDGGTANGGDDTSAAHTFAITIQSVNDAPSFTGGGDVIVNEDSGAYSAAWASGISAGPADESGQTLTFAVSNDNNALFSVQPAISSTGVLTFTTAANAFGSASVTVTLSDDGGTANGGADTSAPQTFTITVNAVNDAPSFTAGGNVTVNEDSGAYSATWATGISAGPGESGQTVAFQVSNDNNALFSAQPAISPAGVLTFTTAANAFGSATVTVTLSDDGGTANGGVDTSAAVTFTITVTAVNDPPTAAGESYDTIGNTMLQVAASQTVAAPAVFVSGSVLSNDSDIDSPGPLTASLVAGSTSPGAVVIMNSNGTFRYLPPAGYAGATDSFSYEVSDGSASATATVTITLKGRVWYVDNNAAPGVGRSSQPFDTLAAAEASSVPGDTIFVHTGDGTTTNQDAGFVLKNGQRLLGQGVALTVPVSVNGGPNPTVLLPAGTKPRITNSAGSGVTAGAVSNVLIAGLDISGASGDGVTLNGTTSADLSVLTITGNLGHGVSGSSVNGFTLADSAVTGNGDDASLDEANLSFTNLSGSASVSNTTIAGAVEDNVRVVNSTGVLNRLTFSSVTVGANHATTGNDGVFLQATGSATMNVTVQNSFFNSARGDLFQFSVRDTAVTDLVFTGNALSNNHANIAPGGGGFTISSGGAAFNATLTYAISNNSFRDALGSAVVIGKGAVGTGSFTGQITNNTIGVASVANSGSAQGSGIVADVLGGGTHTVTISGNQVVQWTNYGILLAAGSTLAGGGQGRLVATVQGNTVSTPSPASAAALFPTSGFRLNSGTTTGDNHNVCLTLGGAGALANALTGAGTNGGADVRLFQRFLTTVALTGYAGANNDNTAVSNFVKANNGGTPTVVASNTVSTGGGGYVGVCPP